MTPHHVSLAAPSMSRAGLPAGSDASIYRMFGVEPVINCAGVRTNYGGSNPCAEVIEAMNAAAMAFVDLDELADAAGAKLGALTGAEWGVVTAGTASGLALATAACIAGNNPELMLRLPDASGLRNKVIIPADQRFAYEQAIRVAGGKIVSVASIDELWRAVDENTAIICLLGRMSGSSLLPLAAVRPVAEAFNIPILVNAAGLSPHDKDRWLQDGADLVVYAGGKYLRGPQSTAIVIGKERLCKAIWRNGAPHQAFGRSMKVGKEEIVGAIVAVDRWINFASAKEERESWLPRLRRIEVHLHSVPGVTCETLSWAGSVTATRLKIIWDNRTIPFNSEDLRLALLRQKPRILIHDFWSTTMSIIIDPINLSDEEAETVGKALAFAFTTPHSIAWVSPNPPAEYDDVSGSWRVDMQFLHGSAMHGLDIQQSGEAISGIHHTATSSGVLSGHIAGGHIRFEAAHEQVPIGLFYQFEGEIVDGAAIRGKVTLGGAAREHLGPVFKAQYGEAEWRATRNALFAEGRSK